MIARRFRPVAAVLATGVLALGLSGCSNRSSDAATVSYTDSTGSHTVHITRSELTDDLHALSTNPQFAQALQQGGFQGVGGNASTDQQLSSRWLTELISQTVADAEFASAHLSVSTADTKTAQSEANATFSTGVMNTLPKAFTARIIGREARFTAVIRYYASCPSGRFVSHILLRTEAEAKKAADLIRSGGATFTQIAKAQSIDTASGKEGGALGCLSPDEFVAPFQDAADAASIGAVTGPVKSQFGYHLILVRPWDPQTDARQYAQALSQAYGSVLAARLAKIKVWVNPLYGTWGPQTDPSTGNTSLAVIPPTVPSPRVCRETGSQCEPTTTTPSTAPAAG